MAGCGIERAEADIVAEEFYGGYCQKVFSDGVVSEDERRTMDRLTTALEIPSEVASSVEGKARNAQYHRAVSSALGDGRISQDELEELESLRRSLGISRKESLALTEDMSRDAYVAEMRRLVRNGRFTPELRDDLARLKLALAISDADTPLFLAGHATDLYRECITMAIQDGVVTPEEHQMLKWLQAETGLSEPDVAPFWKEIRDAERREGYRNGDLPNVRTSKLLEGGETCHWDGPCVYRYETPKSEFRVDGELLITGKRVVFLSPTKSVSFPPSKILDLNLYSDCLEVKASSRQGTGHYFVTDPRELDAVLTGVVRKHKYLLSEDYSSSRTRHIPDEVKREVWDRDGGRCVRCSATDYLEFDHIIPHARGGANTVGNVQLLCRRCNNLKRDRI
ncbi:hypothetical protein BSF38_05182 [Paludisphaera borealis]|uniref:HNH nuclease domain-containing protein n=1 Tax=Paludisphaera borealis TaxID=1387353 RepID=A0A1U7CXJ8_9BACT|nr:hypothetical protein BSF38_05182 [Paludisphaera borealis]